MAADVREVSTDEARRLLGEGAQLIDVRATHEWEAGRIPGAAHLPLDELPQRAGEIEKGRPAVVYCRGDSRSTMAAQALGEAGYDAVSLRDGIVGWAEAGLPLEPQDGYVADSGRAAAIIEARHRAGQT